MFIDMDEKSQVDYPASPSLSLRSRAHALQEIEAEIRQEKAETLRRAGERLEDALNALESAREAGVRSHLDVERSYRVLERLG